MTPVSFDLSSLQDLAAPEFYLQFSPWLIALVLGLLTLLFEDVALVLGVALVHRAPEFGVPIFIGLYIGIVAGDLMLYGAGRWLKHWPRLQRWLDQPQIQRRAELLRGNLWPLIVLCRAIPVSRLPTFVAAGLLKVPVLPFTLVIATTVLAWVGLILFGGVNLTQFVEMTLGISALWLLLPLVMLWLASTIYKHMKQPA